MMIEAMRPDRLGTVKELLDICFCSGAWSDDVLRSQLEKPDSRCTVAVEADTVVGFLAFEQVLDEGSIVEVAVRPGYRRMGIARALIKDAIENAAGLRMIFLEVRESNLPAISLYESLGFERAGVRKNYYDKPKENAVLYSCALS